MIEILTTRHVYIFTKKGKLKKHLSGIGNGILGMWCLQNCTPGACIVLCADGGDDGHLLERVYWGTKDGFPNVSNLDFSLCLDDYILDESHLDIQGLYEDLNDTQGIKITEGTYA